MVKKAIKYILLKAKYKRNTIREHIESPVMMTHLFWNKLPDFSLHVWLYEI